jgi:hypothetical protein
MSVMTFDAIVTLLLHVFLYVDVLDLAEDTWTYQEGSSPPDYSALPQAYEKNRKIWS